LGVAFFRRAKTTINPMNPELSSSFGDFGHLQAQPQKAFGGSDVKEPSEVDRGREPRHCRRSHSHKVIYSIFSQVIFVGLEFHPDDKLCHGSITDAGKA
jgi:hypothetical protein